MAQHEGLLNDLGRPFTRGVVHGILTNEKYIGNNVYNRVSFKLKKTRVVNASDMWIRADGAFDPVIDGRTFFTAQGIIAERNRRFSDAEMIDRLRQLFARHGYLSGVVIDESEGMPSAGAYRHRFGSLLRAYGLVGFTPDRDFSYVEIDRALRAFHHDAVAGTIAGIEALGGHVARDPATDLLTINGEFKASVVVARCTTTNAGRRRWKLRFDTVSPPTSPSPFA